MENEKNKNVQKKIKFGFFKIQLRSIIYKNFLYTLSILFLAFSYSNVTFFLLFKIKEKNNYHLISIFICFMIIGIYFLLF